MVQEAKSPVKNLGMQRCAKGFNSGVKMLSVEWKTVIENPDTAALLPASQHLAV
jgi:hypothetical protein